MKTKEIFFRVDASKEIGMGHLMRCLALAQAARCDGYLASFITIPYSKEAVGKIRKSDFKVFELPPARTWDWKKDAEETLRIMNPSIVNAKKWLVVDNYFFNFRYQKFIKGSGAYLACIDDLAKGKFFADLVINHGLQAKNLRYKVNPDARCLRGVQYALIRKEVLEGARNLSRNKKGVQNILITLGGMCKEKNMKKVSDALSKLKDKGLNIKTAVRSENMSKLYRWADLIFSTASTSAMEASLYGITGIVCTVADNQKLLADKLAENKVFLSVGWLNKANPSDIANSVRKLLNNDKLRLSMSKKAKALINGKGADRVIKEMRAVEYEKS